MMYGKIKWSIFCKDRCLTRPKLGAAVSLGYRGGGVLHKANNLPSAWRRLHPPSLLGRRK